MIAFYISKNNKLESVPAIQQGQNIGFQIPTEHYLLAIVDETGNYSKPANLELSIFEELFLNEHEQADYIGFMQTAETFPAGFRPYDEIALTDRQLIYESRSSIGSFNLVGGPGLSVWRTEIYWHVFGRSPKALGGTQQGNAYIERRQTTTQLTSNNFAIPMAEGDENIIVRYYIDGVPVLWTVPGWPIEAPYQKVPLNSPDRTEIELYEGSDRLLRNLILFGDEAVNHMAALGVPFGSESDFS